MRFSYYNDTYEQQLEILEEASINTMGCIRARCLYDFSAHFSDGVSESDKSVKLRPRWLHWAEWVSITVDGIQW
jgi:hypothetical protein